MNVLHTDKSTREFHSHIFKYMKIHIYVIFIGVSPAWMSERGGQKPGTGVTDSRKLPCEN